MREHHLPRLLKITGWITMLPLLQFLAPSVVLSAGNMQAGDDAGLFFARHWGIIVLCLGALLVYAANRPEIRRAVMFAAAVEKIDLVVRVAMAWNNPALQGMRPAVIADTVMVILYASHLLRRLAA
ncbi:MAG: hypothetical protein MO853_08625 [Candidatus Protistobacter heckmanni]|nr:hypothetical protein [Candidatus Protistobacter heckmanni]